MYGGNEFRIPTPQLTN